MEIKKAILPAAGLGTRFLPLTKSLPKQMLPLVDKPMIEYVASEAVQAGINQLTLVLSEDDRTILDYFKKNSKIEKILEKRNNEELLKELKAMDDFFENVSFSLAIQPKPKGDGDAVLQAKKQIAKSAFGVMFTDDLFWSKIPAISQLKKIFTTAQKPIIGLKKVSPEKLSSYGVMKVEKIAHKLYKIKGIVEKPPLSEAPSDLAICGRYIFTPEIFGYLEKTPATQKGEVILADAIKKMIEDGQIIYGYELDGKWLECGNKKDWLASSSFLLAHHPQYGLLKPTK